MEDEPSLLEAFPDEALVNIFYNLDAEELSRVCRTNSNLSRFCNETGLRLNALRRSLSRRTDLDRLFATLILHGREDRDIERLGVILEIHPQWVNGVITFVYEEEPDGEYYIRPLEASNNVKVISLLLVRGADPNLPALYLSHGYRHLSESDDKIIIQGVSLEEPPVRGNLLSILLLSMRLTNPTLHLLFLQRGYVVPWSTFGLSFGKLNLDILMYYAVHHTPTDLSFLNPIAEIGNNYVFPLLQLLRSSSDKNGFTADEVPHDRVIHDVLAVYRPLYNKLTIDTRLTIDNSVTPSFATLRQLQFAFPNIPDRALFGDLNVEEHISEISSLILPVTDATGKMYHYRLNYYQACGLIGAFLALGRDLPYNGIVMEQEVEVEKVLPIRQDYRFDPEARIFPHLLRYVDEQGRERLVQYEDRDYEAGFRLGLSLFNREDEFSVLA